MKDGSTVVEVIFKKIFGKGKSSAITNRKNEVILKMVRMHILEMEDVLFHLNSCVVMPENPQGKSSSDGDMESDDETLDITGIKALAIVFKQFEFDPSKRMIIAGHTDTSGTDEFNFKLSDERAKNILYLLIGEKTEWAKLSYGRHKVEDYQQIMKYFEKKLSCGCDPGDIDDKWGDNTRAASKNFFNKVLPGKSVSMLAKVENDQKKRWPVEAWEAVYDLYSKEMADVLEVSESELNTRRTTEIKFVDDKKQLVGCGESFPIESKEKNNYRSQKNRRVEILFFDKDETPEINCPAQIKKAHTEEECPLWKKFYFVPLYIDPKDLKSVVYHLQFVYYDKVKRKQLPVPKGLFITAYEDGNKKLPTETIFKDGVYYVKVQFKKTIKDPARTKLYFEFNGTDRWIYTKDDKSDPIVVIMTKKDYDALSFAEKQKYYDLPVKWSSQNYWTRYDGDFNKGDRFEKVFKDIQKLKPFGDEVTKTDKPLVFSMDDFVLTNSDLKPISQPVGSYEAAILNSEFAVYNPDTDNFKSYYSKNGLSVTNEFQYLRVPAAEENLRGVIIKHNAAGVTFKYKLFVVFEDRVPITHELAGYRAAVFEHKSRCILIKQFQQRHLRDYHNIGRFDSYLLRDLYLNDEQESVSFIFNYFRWHLRGANPPTINQQWTDTAITNLIDEWNNKSENELVSLIGKKGDTNYRIYIRFYIEQVPFAEKETLVNVNPSGTGRSNMGRDEGNIKIDEHERNTTTKSFTGAHEFGHAASLDDDYIETVNYCSYFRVGFLDFKPGGPFNLDSTAMMKTNQQVRSRYYWHFATWMYKEFVKGKKIEFTVIRKNKDDFVIPQNPSDSSDPRDFSKDSNNYINHPYKFVRNTSNSKSTQTYKGKFHSYLYVLGKDEYSKGGLYGTEEFTGLMVVIVNIFIQSWVGNPTFVDIYDRLIQIETDINSNFLKKNGIKIKGNKPFHQTFVQVVPRFLVNHYSSDYTTEFPTVTNADFNANRDFALGKPEGSKHLIVKIISGDTSFDVTKDPPELSIKNNNTELRKFWKYFSQTLGLSFGATLNENNFGVSDFVPGGIVKKI
jgi:hypothetical protein